MDSDQFHNVSFLKPNITIRYTSVICTVSLKFILFSLTLLLFNSSIANIISTHLHQLSVFLQNPHVIFVILNTVIVLVFVCMRSCNVTDIDGTVTVPRQFPIMQAMMEQTGSDRVELKCDVVVDPAIELGRFERDRCIMHFDSEIEKAKKIIKRFERIHSENLKREIAVKHRAKPEETRDFEILKVEEEDRRLVVLNWEERMEVDKNKLSVDELNQIVEAYIKKQHQSLAQEREMDI